MFVSLGVLSMCVLSVPSRAAAAVTLYVSPAGSDSNPGTAQQPFRTIQRAADLVNPGDTVIVEDGVYTGGGTVSACGSGTRPVLCISRGGTASAPVTFRARNRWGARLDGQHNTSTDGIRVVAGAAYVHIEGFEIFGAGNNGSASGIELYSGGANAVIAGNHIHDIGRLCTDTSNGQVGIYVRQPGVVITGNRIHDIGRYGPGEQGCSPNSYYQNHDHGVYASGASTPGPRDLVISNNVFYNNRRGWSVHLYPGTLNNISILNNTFAFENPDRAGHIIIYASTSNSRIINNVFYRPKTAAITYSSGTQTGLEVTNNVVYNGTMMTTVPSGTTMAANRVADPLLVNPTSYDFHLTGQSPAINAALSVPEVTVDFDGTPRATGVADIGAFEYADGGTVTTQVATPTISPNGGTITGPTTVTIATTTSGASIRYTKDGSTPTSSSPLYSGAFTIDATVTIRAQAFKSGMLDSQVAVVTFQKSDPPTEPPPPTDPPPTDPSQPDPTPTDTTPPTVAITEPANGSRITRNGPVTIAAAASDDVKVASVRFSIDGKTISTDTTAPYSTTYKFNKTAAGQHVLTATVTDTAGNTATASITVTR